jgi:hypothetical protein
LLLANGGEAKYRPFMLDRWGKREKEQLEKRKKAPLGSLSPSSLYHVASTLSLSLSLSLSANRMLPVHVYMQL